MVRNPIIHAGLTDKNCHACPIIHVLATRQQAGSPADACLGFLLNAFHLDFSLP
jgi:hypothetical protein